MFGWDDAIMLALAASGGAEALFGGKKTARQKAMEARLKQRMDHGLSAQELGDISGRYAPQINRAAAVQQRQMARAYAASGGSGSSEMISQIGDIPQVGNVLPGILAEADLNARKTAEGQYYGLETGLDAQRNASIEGGMSTVGSALGTWASGLGNTKPDYVLPDLASPDTSLMPKNSDLGYPDLRTNMFWGDYQDPNYTANSRRRRRVNQDYNAYNY
jgi:hypothetical protein